MRVHLTNRFGVAPLVITGATIGTAGPGGAVTAGTLRALTLSGNELTKGFDARSSSAPASPSPGRSSPPC